MISFGKSVKVSIDISTGDEGFYLFNGRSACGKTFLADIFKKHSTKGNLYVTTYEGGKVCTWGNKDTAKVFLYDRLDLYLDSVVDEINKYADSKFIFADLKHMNMLDNSDINVSVGFAKLILLESALRLEVLI